MGKMITHVAATVKVPGMHNWPEAPDEVSFLRHKHRHMFHIKVTVEVDHDDRAVEFFTLQKEIVAVLNLRYVKHEGIYLFGNYSCEHIAKDLFDFHPNIQMVTVSEDGENEATVFEIPEEDAQ